MKLDVECPNNLPERFYDLLDEMIPPFLERLALREPLWTGGIENLEESHFLMGYLPAEKCDECGIHTLTFGTCFIIPGKGTVCGWCVSKKPEDI